MQDVEVIKQFREYKVGREKLFLDFLQEKGKDHPDFEDAMDEIKGLFGHYMRSEGMDDNRIAVEKGDAFEKSILEMARDLGEDEEMMYTIIYKRTSDIIHGNWRVIEKYHLERSLNPAQDNSLRYRTTNNTYAGLLPSFLGLILATRGLMKFLELYEPIRKKNKKVYNSLLRYYRSLNSKYLELFGYTPDIKKS